MRQMLLIEVFVSVFFNILKVIQHCFEKFFH